MNHAAVLVLAIALAPSAATYRPDPGPLRVQTIERLSLQDSARGKTLLAKVYYPEGAGPFPVIVFSHGLYGSRETYRGLAEYWTSHGYVAILPSHDDSRLDRGYRRRFREALRDSALWESRPEDVRFVIGALGEIERAAPALRGRLDPSRVGMGGHSYGAYTAEAIAGATIQMPGASRPRSFADPRVKAVVALSPQQEGEMGLTRDSWASLRLPMLLMYGSRDIAGQRRTPNHTSQPFAYGPKGDKYDVELEGATHMTFVGRLALLGGETRLFQCVKLETLAFWDAYLKHDPAGQRYLASDDLNGFCGGAARISRK
jgi:predicted dienelactone hydrolase